MHILYHHRTAGDRVEQVHIVGMANAFRGLGHTVEISSPPGCDPERKRARAEPASGPAPVEGRIRRTLKRFARAAPCVCFELAELLYNLYSLGDLLRRGFRRKPDMIYERMTSNSMAPTLMANCWKIPIIQEVNVTTEIGRLRPLVLRRLTRGIEQRMIGRTSLFLTVSSCFKSMMAEQGFPPERILVCQNAIDPEMFDPQTIRPAPRPAHVSDDALLIGYVGAFVPWHRVDLLVEAARQLAPHHPNARWLLVGDGVDRHTTEALLADHGLTDKFWLSGAVQHKLVPAYVKAMDVAVMPHSNPHGSPMKVFEYMAMGRAVVVPRMPAIEEVVRHGKTGLLFEPGNAAALRAALEYAMRDPGLRARLGRQARDYVLGNCTWRRNAERVLERLRASPSSERPDGRARTKAR